MTPAYQIYDATTIPAGWVYVSATSTSAAVATSSSPGVLLDFRPGQMLQRMVDGFVALAAAVRELEAELAATRERAC